LDEAGFARIVEEAGGRAYIVGGWVRDTLRGECPHDRDYVLSGLSEDAFRAIFPGAVKTGRGFPVYILEISGEKCDVAFARRDVKTGRGYRGFEVSFEPGTSIEDDLSRRDTTMNSIAIRLLTGEITDPFGGGRDIGRRLIRATSRHFTDDPVRALRAARQSAQFGFAIDGGTVEMMGMCGDELAGEPPERLAGELALALASARPSLFFRALAGAGILNAAYPQIYSLIGVEQGRKYHPEGDAFEHTMNVLDETSRAADRTEVRFAALTSDLGKALAPPESRPHHCGRERLGLVALEEWRRAMPLPRLWTDCAAFVITERMRARAIVKPGKITGLLCRLRRHPLGADGFAAIIRAGSHIAPDYIENARKYYEAMDAISGESIPPALEGRARGEWLRGRRIEAVARVLAARMHL